MCTLAWNKYCHVLYSTSCMSRQDLDMVGCSGQCVPKILKDILDGYLSSDSLVSNLHVRAQLATAYSHEPHLSHRLRLKCEELEVPEAG